MQRERLLKQVKKIVERSDYLQVFIENVRSAVDLIAERKGRKIVAKIVKNIDSVSEEAATELSSFANFIGAKPVIIGEFSSNGKLKDDFVYSRFSIDCVSIEGFEDMISELPQPKAAKSVGAKIKINGSKLRAIRSINNMSAKELAKKIGVSSNSIYRYEEKSPYASLEVVKKINNLFKERIELNAYEDTSQKVEVTTFTNIKLSAIITSSMPFDLVAKGNVNYYEVCTENDMRTLIKRAKVMKEIKETFENNYPFFVIESKREEIIGLPVISKKVLNEINSENKLLELIMG